MLPTLTVAELIAALQKCQPTDKVCLSPPVTVGPVLNAVAGELVGVVVCDVKGTNESRVVLIADYERKCTKSDRERAYITNEVDAEDMSLEKECFDALDKLELPDNRRAAVVLYSVEDGRVTMTSNIHQDHLLMLLEALIAHGRA